MAKYDWVKLFPDKAMGGIAELTAVERGIYLTILILIFMREDKLPDDDRYIAGSCLMDLRQYRRIKRTLIDKKKIAISDGNIINLRASLTVQEAIERVEKKATAARKAANARWDRAALDSDLSDLKRPKSESNKKDEAPGDAQDLHRDNAPKSMPQSSDNNDIGDAPRIAACITTGNASGNAERNASRNAEQEQEQERKSPSPDYSRHGVKEVVSVD